MSSLPPRPTARRALRLEFFGGPTLWREDTPIRISPFQAGLLSLAFGTGQTRIPRSTVQELLWNCDSDKVVRHRMSQLVYQTNHRCQTRVIELEGEHLRANTQAVATDLEELMGMIRTSDFPAACDILERGFLSAFPSRKTDAFSDWIDKQELGMRIRLRNKAVADWNASEAVQDWSGACSSAEALYRLDPHDEAVLRRVLKAHAMGGRVEEAEAVYRSFAERADPSGDWTPQRATRTLLRSVKSVHQRPPEQSGFEKAQGPKVPLTGRAQELSRLIQRICENRHRNAWSIVTLRGEPGIGKTRLIDEAIQGAQLRGKRVMYASPGELERGILLSPLLEALNSPSVGSLLTSVPDPWLSHLRSLLPQFDSAENPPPCEQGDRLHHHTCEALLHLFAAIAQSPTSVFVIDNFHWVDEATATVLQFLHRRLRMGQLALVLSYRQEELGRNDIAARLIRHLESEPEAMAIRLQELERSAAHELVASLGTDQLARSTVDHIVDLAGGNPLFLMKIAANVVSGGESKSGIRIPASVRRGIVRRIGDLAPRARGIMSALAVFGHPATMRCLTGITGHTRHQCIDALDLLYERHFIEWARDKVGVRKNIVREAVYEELSPTRRSLLHALTAEMLRSGVRKRRPDRIAMHHYHAGEHQLACIYALEAAKSSKTRRPGDRSKFLEIAYETSEGARQQGLTIPLARALHRTRRPVAALRYARKALSEVQDLPLAESSTGRLIVADARHLLGRRATTTTLDQLAELEAALREDDEAVRAEVLDTMLRVLHREGDHDAVTRLFTRVKRLDGLRDPVANCRVLAILAVQAKYNDPAEGLVCARRAVAIASQHNLQDDEMLARQRHIAALAATGALATDEGRTSVAQGRIAARKSDDLASYLLILLELARWHTSTGSLDIAAAALDEALLNAKLTDCPEIHCLLNLASGNLAMARGNLPAANTALSSVLGSGERTLVETSLPHGDGLADLPAEEPGQTPVPPYLTESLAALEGNVLLETGKLRQATGVSETHAVEEPLTRVAVDLVLFHARLLSRKGATPRALDLLVQAAAAHEDQRPLHWLRITLDLVRLARRSGSPRPELATRARDLAFQLDLPGLAHEFVPFM